MFAWIANIFAIIKGVISLWNYMKNFMEEQRLAQAKKKADAREKAAEGLKQCKTEEECDAQSDALHSNSH